MPFNKKYWSYKCDDSALLRSLSRRSLCKRKRTNRIQRKWRNDFQYNLFTLHDQFILLISCIWIWIIFLETELKMKNWKHKFIFLLRVAFLLRCLQLQIEWMKLWRKPHLKLSMNQLFNKVSVGVKIKADIRLSIVIYTYVKKQEK